MANKRPKPEEIVSKLRQVEVLMGQGMSRLEEARIALDECERVEPGRVQMEFQLDPIPYQNLADHEHILDGLRKAGWED